MYVCGTLCTCVVHYVRVWYIMYVCGTLCTCVVHYIRVWYIMAASNLWVPHILTIRDVKYIVLAESKL